MTLRTLLQLPLILAAALSAQAFELPSSSTQCLVGIAGSWDSSHATLCLYQKDGGQWKQEGEPWKARLGKAGLIWGSGIQPAPPGAATKKEGDWRSPAGVFRLGGVWGYDTSIRKDPKLFYRKVTSRDLWVEDPASPQYNRHVILDREPATTWEKKQQMKQNDAAHALKLFIAHNAPPKVVPGDGSSIFFHIWRGGGSKPTAGCTTMEETKLRSLIANLNPASRPLYILLPRAEYERYRTKWKLP